VATLHITNGDCAAETLRQIVTEPVVTAADVLHEGPCPPVNGEAWYETRARFLAGGDPVRTAEIKSRLAAGDRQIVDAARATASPDRNEIVLWFEHDLFDQLAIVRVLDLIAREKGGSGGRPRVSLICPGAFPGVDRFVGLGQLTADQLATLKGTGTPMTAGHFELAVDAWGAFRDPNPSGLFRICQQLTASQVGGSEGGASLTFLGDALLRFFAEYPSAANGLSRTEGLALDRLRPGPMTAAALFTATQAFEARPFLGDLPFFDTLRRLATARTPLVTMDGDGGDPRRQQTAITDAGRQVLALEADHVRLNGIDIWRGGVHLAGSNHSPWRWDAGAETLVS
jgi:hypothetical protein